MSNQFVFNQYYIDFVKRIKQSSRKMKEDNSGDDSEEGHRKYNADDYSFAKKILKGIKVNYITFDKSSDDYVKFLKTNKRYEKAGGFKSKTSGEFFSALQTAGYATDPNYASKLTNATEGTAKQVAGIMGTPSMTGPALASASTASSDLNRASSTQQPPIVNVNAPQTTNVAGVKGGEQQVASATNIDALDLFFKFAM